MLLPFARKREERKMADNRRYYWLKLKEDFFTDERIKKTKKNIRRRYLHNHLPQIAFA